MNGGSYGITLIIAAGLAFIPANIAKKKGYSFGLWWFYGWMLFIVAIIHVNLIPDKNAQTNNTARDNSSSIPDALNTVQSAADELRKYKDLLDSGALTEEEFQLKKEQLLKEM